MSEWKIVEFKELASSENGSFAIGPFGSAITADNYVPEGVPVVRGVNLAQGVFVDDEFVYITDQKADELKRANLAPGDLVFTHRGTIGQVSMIPHLPKFPRYVLSSSQVKARIDSRKALPEFYYYWFRSPEGRRSLLANASTVGVPGIASPLTTIRSLLVPYPPIHEQRAIAVLLGALDGKIAVNERIAAISLELAMVRYREAVSDGRFNRSILLGDCGQWRSGGTPDTSEGRYWGGGIPWISASSLKSPWIDDSDRRITPLGAENGTRLVPKDAIIFVVRGMSLISEFRVGLTQREVAFGQDCKALLPAHGIDAAVLLLAIKSRTTDILGLVDYAGHGTGRLATDLISGMKVDLSEAQANADTVAALRSMVQIGAARQVENRDLQELRNTLLPRVMSGEIRVRDAEKIVEDVT